MANKGKPIKNYIRGDTRIVKVQFLDADGVTPHDMTGCKAYFTLNRISTPSDDSGALIALETTTFDPAEPGIAAFTLSHTLTQQLDKGTYYYDVQLRDANGNITSSPQSTFTVVDDITIRVN